MFTKNVAKTYGRSVYGRTVCPGVIETAGLAALRTRSRADRGVPEEGALERVMVEEWHMDVALGRPGRAEEVGELFAFLLFPRAGYLTGVRDQHRRRNRLLTARRAGVAPGGR